MENNITCILLETFDDLFAAKNIRDNEALAYLHAKKCWFTVISSKISD